MKVPVKNKTSEDVLKALKKIYSRGILELPKQHIMEAFQDLNKYFQLF